MRSPARRRLPTTGAPRELLGTLELAEHQTEVKAISSLGSSRDVRARMAL